MQRVSAAIGIPNDRFDWTGKRIDEVLGPVDGLTAEQRNAAAEAWYRPDVPHLEPLPGARELLAAIRGRARLFLLTRGNPVRQQNKVKSCGLGPYFEDCYIRPIEGPGSKRDDIEAILSRTGLPANRCAVVGDDPRDELLHAADLGCLGILVPKTPLSSVLKTLQQAGLLSVS